MKKAFFSLCLLVSAQLAYAQGDEVSVLKVYPDTANTYVNVYVTFEQPTDFSIIMVSRVWTEAKELKEHAKESYQKKIDVHNLPEGKYSFFLEYDGHTERKDFVIKHK